MTQSIEKNEESLSIMLSILYRYGSNYITRKLKPHGIGAGQHAFLLAIADRAGISQEQLSRHFQVDKSLVARAVKKLEASNFITRIADKSDKRKNNLFITDKGRAMIPFIYEAIGGWNQTLLESIPPGQEELLKSCLIGMVGKIVFGQL